MAIVYLSLGSNKKNRKKYLQEALIKLSKLGILTAISNIYETEPWGFYSPNNFYNLIVKMQTNLPPFKLLSEIKYIEQLLGRDISYSEVYRSREIDIDIIFYDNLILNSEKLIIPHKYAHKRKFVLLPMAEINPLKIHPVLNKTISDLIKECPDKSFVKIIGKLPLPEKLISHT